jgi:DNA-binding winged helix-turn-helix (wHTH) protein/tetratricopeptide (TPR) repeat protein
MTPDNRPVGIGGRTVYRFAGFELDQRRAELRGPDGKSIKLRPKTFSLLLLLLENNGRVVGKQEVIDALWPNVHVGEDGLFQCVREVRVALGDHRREMLKLVPGRGYILNVDVTDTPTTVRPQDVAPVTADIALATPRTDEPVAPRHGGRGRMIALVVIGLCVVVGLGIGASVFGLDTVFGRRPPAIVVIPIVDASADPEGAEMAEAVTARLIDGLARIDTVRVVIAQPEQAASLPRENTDFVIRGELRREGRSWTLQARMIRTATGEVLAVAGASADGSEEDLELQQSRLAAGAGHLLAQRLNDLMESGGAQDSTTDSSAGAARFVIDQASASINQTSRERFHVAEAMLQDALAAEPDNIDLAVALAGLQLRGVQMAWYTPQEVAAIQAQTQATLERARRVKPNSIAVAETYCRFLSATNRFVESLVECSRTLSLDPWDGLALYHVGLGQVHLGRFDDALATFQQADRIDTPPVSRWTWLLGAGWANLLLGRPEAALPWLHRSIAITPASGRSHMLLAVAYQQTGRIDDAKAAMREGLRLRPGSTALNIAPPYANASPAYVQASERLIKVMVQAGLPER